MLRACQTSFEPRRQLVRLHGLEGHAPFFAVFVEDWHKLVRCQEDAVVRGVWLCGSPSYASLPSLDVC